MSLTTNHNKAAVRGLASQPIMAYVGHLISQLSVATLAVADRSTTVVHTMFEELTNCFWDDSDSLSLLYR